MRHLPLDFLRSRTQRRLQRGVGMIEMMVAMVLGAMVVIGVIQVFTANRQTFRMQDGMAMTQESGTFALDFIGRDMLRGGKKVDVALAVNDAVAFDWANTVDGGAGNNDSLAVVYRVSIDDAATYCTGEATGTAELISNRYWVNADDELMCQGAAFNGVSFETVGTPQVLVDNVESFQVLFGVDSNTAGGAAECDYTLDAPSLYVRSTLIAAAIARTLVACPAAAASATVRPGSSVMAVRTLRLGLLLRTENAAGAIVDAGRTYPVLDELIGAPQITPNDGRLRRLFSKTIMLRTARQVLTI
jgi:type IV pilus assembly protein PilW